MELPVQITYRNVTPSQAATARIESEATKLDDYFERITSCRVVVEAPHRHHKQGEHFHVRIELGVPGTQLVISHAPSLHATLSREEETALSKHVEVHPEHRDLYVVIRDAFAIARRQLQEYAKRIRGEVKTHASDLSPHLEATGQ